MQGRFHSLDLRPLTWLDSHREPRKIRNQIGSRITQYLGCSVQIGLLLSVAPNVQMLRYTILFSSSLGVFVLFSMPGYVEETNIHTWQYFSRQQSGVKWEEGICHKSVTHHLAASQRRVGPKHGQSPALGEQYKKARVWQETSLYSATRTSQHVHNNIHARKHARTLSIKESCGTFIKTIWLMRFISSQCFFIWFPLFFNTTYRQPIGSIGYIGTGGRVRDWHSPTRFCAYCATAWHATWRQVYTSAPRDLTALTKQNSVPQAKEQESINQ